MDSLQEAYVAGYYYGRAIGSDEAWAIEAKDRGWDLTGPERDKFKEGYERGVADYVEFDEPKG